MLFSYADIFTHRITCCKRSSYVLVNEHTLIYIFSGSLIIRAGKRKTEIQQGECIYIRRNSNIRYTEIPDITKPYQAICMNFPVLYLRFFFENIRLTENLRYIINLPLQNSIKLPCTPYISSLFTGMYPYFESGFIPCNEIVDLKLQQGVYSMLYVIQNCYTIIKDYRTCYPIENITIDLN